MKLGKQILPPAQWLERLQCTVDLVVNTVVGLACDSRETGAITAVKHKAGMQRANEIGIPRLRTCW
jgi:hypothetical protein